MGLDFLRRYGAKRTVKPSGSGSAYDIIDTQSLKEWYDQLLLTEARAITNKEAAVPGRQRDIVGIKKELQYRGVKI